MRALLFTTGSPYARGVRIILHELGLDLADLIHLGNPQGSSLSFRVTTREFRTQPLWGVSLHPPFLHDGRAETLEEAILWHGGEAEAIRDAYEALRRSEKDDVIEFLEHL